MVPSIDPRRRSSGSSNNSNHPYTPLPRQQSGSQGSSSSLPSYYARGAQPKQKAGPNRSTKASGKLKILPEEPEEGNMTDPPTVRFTTSSKPRHPPPTHTPIEALRRKPYPYSSSSVDRNAADRDGPEHDDDDDDDRTSSEGDDDVDEAEQDEYRARLYQQLAQIPEGNMRRDARRLTRKARASLPRVTAYSTATSYRMRDLTKWLQARRETHQTNVMSFDECVYTTYSYARVDANRQAHQQQQQQQNSRSQQPAIPNGSIRRPSTSTSTSGPKTGDLLGIPELHSRVEETTLDKTTSSDSMMMLNSQSDFEAVANANDLEAAQVAAEANVGYGTSGEGGGDGLGVGVGVEEGVLSAREKKRKEDRFSVHGNVPEVFFMEYGTVVIWGMTLAEEKRLLRELKKFEVEKLAPEDIESEDLNWYLADYSRIYNDVITLRRGSSYMTKLSLSHALAQSTKISFFEGVIDNTIDSTKDIPQSIAESGKIGMPPAEIMKQIGHLFILRMNIHLVGSIVDSPEIFWSQPDLEPLYSAARSYLEIPQRIDLLNARVEVLQDMLQLLKDQVTSSHSEWLEIIVIVLIVLEIILGVATMCVDLFFA
ncbi:hypothetical protein CF319_g5126 [Tilletia indica]|nr:hypothetical protein CF319_g5126 [Tilletia indica]